MKFILYMKSNKSYILSFSPAYTSQDGFSRNDWRCRWRQLPREPNSLPRARPHHRLHQRLQRANRRRDAAHHARHHRHMPVERQVQEVASVDPARDHGDAHRDPVGRHVRPERRLHQAQGRRDLQR